ncbi:polyhydroxyalkanoate depolymerase [Novosphingobium sp.]|uniref:polyhydroxyalkanoate depolymerase n=1 Tax=Novosphingobium sp. TaxID=1874826 RepID=UPI0022C3C163|nr:polyhydroxyalkanoate depolymerase [Novosphingobium sp.]MCZ8018762.1 polyhydroxyalkanoate depolymerase [Novosphingobium sp.]MCZ8034767.1 polyhydroxyalkanoate depolymerase [Novosphingobium sp.]MCZ8052902.1 polyhydroxyalkanoate depolymerase [Novosphingobium sp.]MCZ8060660.1 polyhydroxyalkanoate depolymerase [Novosphingobium sp.]MCZ8230686.1 polyhydroxyalkanoate depolymerase [Novosphingobium sp.]
MLYTAYELQRSWLNAASTWASVGADLLSNPALPFGYSGLGPVMASALEVFAHASAPYGKPAFDIESVEVDGTSYPVTEAIVMHRPFGNLLRFSHPGLPADAPRLLIVAPMSGHFATLLRGTVARMVENCEVFITDWADAKTVPLEAGRFDLDDYIDYLIGFLEHIGPNAHMLAVCQPSVPALAATALLAGRKHPCRPLTLTMMGGPVDTREAPTSVNDLAMQRPLEWFKHTVIATVPLQYPGAGRRVYPGFLQLAGFMSMNLGNHMLSHYHMFKHLVAGDGESAEATKAFYDEYRAVCDMDADYYLQTIEQVFQRQSLAQGEFMHRGERVDLGAIKDTALLAVEGERDDISGIGQTRAALKLAVNLPESRKRYHLAPEVGHYGIFNGSKWRNQIAPVLEDWIKQHDKPRLKVAA